MFCAGQHVNVITFTCVRTTEIHSESAAKSSAAPENALLATGRCPQNQQQPPHKIHGNSHHNIGNHLIVLTRRQCTGTGRKSAARPHPSGSTATLKTKNQQVCVRWRLHRTHTPGPVFHVAAGLDTCQPRRTSKVQNRSKVPRLFFSIDMAAPEPIEVHARGWKLVGSIVTAQIKLLDAPTAVELNEEHENVEVSGASGLLTHKVSLPFGSSLIEDLACKWDRGTHRLRLNITVTTSFSSIVDSAHVSMPEQANPALQFGVIPGRLATSRGVSSCCPCCLPDRRLSLCRFRQGIHCQARDRTRGSLAYRT